MRKSERPASSTSTLVEGSALIRLAIAQPGGPATDDDVVPVSRRLPTAHAPPLPRNQPVRRRRDVVPDVLGLAVLLEPGLAELAADAGLLVAAPLRLGDVGVVVVDPDGAHAQPAATRWPAAGVLGPHRAGQAVDRVVGDADGVVLVGEGLDGQHRTERLVADDAHAASARRRGSSARRRSRRPARPSVTRWPPSSTVGALGDPGLDVRRDLVEVALRDQGAGLGLLVERSTQPDRRARAPPARRRTPRRSTPARRSRAPAEQTWPECRNTAVSAMSSALSRSASAKTMLGFLPPSSSATFFTVPEATAMIRLPVSRPPVNETRSTRGSSLSGAPACGPVADHEVADPGRQAGLVEQPHQVDRGVRRELAGLEHEGAAGRERRRDLPGDLEQRVVPGRDQPADADGLVHDPADHVGAAGVDDPARLGVGHAGRSGGRRW